MTAPLSQPLSCTLWVDGIRVADGAVGDDTLAPTALSGLSVTWGRATTLDQPEPATCTVDVLDAAGGARYQDLFATGRTLEVRTDTTVYPDPTVPTITDPGFDAGGPGRVTDNATVTVAGGKATVAGKALTRRALVAFAPAAFVPEGSSPDAWDGIPKTAAGQTWRFGATVTVPAGAGATVVPVAYTGPWASTATVLAGPAVTVPADGAPHPVAASFLPPPGVWLGVAVTVWPHGYQWDTVPPAVTWDTVTPAAATWDSLGTVTVDDLLVLAPAAGTAKSAVVFSGRITDLAAQFVADAGGGGVLLQVTAQDHTSELANRDTGAEPWVQETLGARAQRVVTASGQPTAITVDPGAAAVVVSRLDVDNQPCLDLLQDLAATCDGVLWSAVHTLTGQYLWIEDTAARPPLLTLHLVGGVVVITANPDPATATHLSGCDVLMDPARWVQDVADVATRVAVRWLEAGVDGSGKPITTDRTSVVQNDTLIADLGVRRVSVGTLLVDAASALALGDAVLARTSDRGWRVAGLTWSTGLEPLDQARVATAFELLDGTTRLGRPMVLADLPEWIDPAGDATVPLYLEGGSYRFEDGAWTLGMLVSAARAQGKGPQWDQLGPTWQWDQFDPGITWQDLAGTAAA